LESFLLCYGDIFTALAPFAIVMILGSLPGMRKVRDAFQLPNQD